MNKKLYRSVKDKVLGGVAGGLAEYFEVDPVIVRVLFVVSLFFHGVGFIAYIIIWLIIPEAPYVFEGAANFNSSNAAHTSSSSEGKPAGEDPAANYFKNLEEKRLKRNKNIGIIMIVIGFIFLADNFIPRIHFADFWPIILVALGINLLMNSKKL
jgi:phage shock protein PspC (stress-responsive transcriptional regulator)